MLLSWFCFRFSHHLPESLDYKLSKIVVGSGTVINQPGGVGVRLYIFPRDLGRRDSLPSKERKGKPSKLICYLTNS